LPPRRPAPVEDVRAGQRARPARPLRPALPLLVGGSMAAVGRHPRGGLLPAGRMVSRLTRARRDALYARGRRALPVRWPDDLPRLDRRGGELRLALRPHAGGSKSSLRQSTLSGGAGKRVSVLAGGRKLAGLVHVRP